VSKWLLFVLLLLSVSLVGGCGFGMVGFVAASLARLVLVGFLLPRRRLGSFWWPGRRVLGFGARGLWLLIVACAKCKIFFSLLTSCHAESCQRWHTQAD